jgi:hypothetical protein
MNGASRRAPPTRRPGAIPKKIRIAGSHNAMVRWVNNAMSFAMALACLAVLAVNLRWECAMKHSRSHLTDGEYDLAEGLS